MDIGKRLRELREAKGLSQRDIEKRTGLFRSYVSRVECGHAIPRLETLGKWAKALRLPLSALFVEDYSSRAEHQRRVTMHPSYPDNRLFALLKRMSEIDRRLFLYMARGLAKHGSGRG